MAATSKTDWTISKSLGYPRGFVAIRQRGLDWEAVVETRGQLALACAGTVDQVMDDATVYPTHEQAEAAAARADQG